MKKIDSLLLIDDDEFFQFLTKRMIESTSLVEAVRIFSNGLEAIEFLKQAQSSATHLPDVILLDLSMPVMDGWEFLEEYLLLQPRLSKTITIYIVSSSISPGDVEKARTINAVTDYIIKPVTKERFMEMLKNL